MNGSLLSALSRRHLPAGIDRVLRDLFLRTGRRAYSQEGEDLILRRYFERRRGGFFVDIGAHHPFRFSNTYAFYRSGWRGINVDAMPGSMSAFQKFRPLDVNIESGVGKEAATVPFYIFSDAALNTFDPAMARQRESAVHRIVAIQDVTVRTLDSLLAEHLPAGQSIDFMTIDVEGHDQAVLESKSWTENRPEVIVIETASVDIAALLRHPCTAFLQDVGYRPFAKAIHSSFYIDSKVLDA